MDHSLLAMLPPQSDKRVADRKDFTSERGTDLCVVCHRDTGVPTPTPIKNRTNYVQGVGQCCTICVGIVDIVG